MLSCVDVVDRTTDYLEAELGAAERLAFEQHVAICPPCRAHLTQMRVTRATIATLPAEPLSPELEQRVVDAFRAWRDAR